MDFAKALEAYKAGKKIMRQYGKILYIDDDKQNYIKFTQEDNNLTGEFTLSARIRDEQAPSSAYIDAFVTKNDAEGEWIIIQDINMPCENQKVNFEYQLNEGEFVSRVDLNLKNVIAVINQ